MEGARLLREKRVQGRTHRRKGAEGGPPAESECLEWKSTFEFFKNPKKTVGNADFSIIEIGLQKITHHNSPIVLILRIDSPMSNKNK